MNKFKERIQSLDLGEAGFNTARTKSKYSIWKVSAEVAHIHHLIHSLLALLTAACKLYPALKSLPTHPSLWTK